MLADRFDGVLIDFYGTISAGDRAAVEATCTRIVEVCGLSVTPQEFAIRWGERFFSTIAASNHDRFQTLYACEISSLASILADFGETRDPVPFVADLEAYWRDPPIYMDALEFLKSVDLPVCCVSNADTAPLLAAIERHDLRFDAVITSEAARCYKPDPAIFQKALSALGVRPDRAVHVGDSVHSDVGGARASGVSPVWLCRENRIHDIGNADEVQPEAVIENLSDVF